LWNLIMVENRDQPAQHRPALGSIFKTASSRMFPLPSHAVDDGASTFAVKVSDAEDAQRQTLDHASRFAGVLCVEMAVAMLSM